MERGDRFDHPLIERYASRDMARLFSPRARHGAWRDLWICLAEAEQKLGFPVTEAQIRELKEHRDTFDWDRVAALEKELRQLEEQEHGLDQLSMEYERNLKNCEAIVVAAETKLTAEAQQASEAKKKQMLEAKQKQEEEARAKAAAKAAREAELQAKAKEKEQEEAIAKRRDEMKQKQLKEEEELAQRRREKTAADLLKKTDTTK